MALPTYLVLGAQKAGTTWLASMLAQHPEIAQAPQKEVHYFSKRETYERGRGWYEAQFGEADGALAIGEATPNYLNCLSSQFLASMPERVARAYPGLRLVVCLRDPVDRAASGFYHTIRAGRRSPRARFLDVCAAGTWSHDHGRYGAALDRWLETFPLDRFLFLVYEEDIRPDAAKPDALRRAFAHLGVDEDFVPGGVSERRNVRSEPFDLWVLNAPRPVAAVLRRFPRAVREWSVWDVPVSDDDRAALAESYREDTARVEEIVGRPMPWLTSRGRTDPAEGVGALALG